MQDIGVSDDSLPNLDSSDGNTLVEYVMRKRNRRGPIFKPPTDKPKQVFNLEVIHKPVTTTNISSANDPDALGPLPKSAFRSDAKKRMSLGRQVLLPKCDPANPVDKDFTLNITNFNNPQASSTPSHQINEKSAAPTPQNLILHPIGAPLSPNKTVQIPGVEIHINVNRSKKTPPKETQTSVEAPLYSPDQPLSAAPSTPKAPTIANKENAAQQTPVLYRTPQTPGTRLHSPRNPSLKENLLAVLNEKYLEKTAKQALMAASPSMQHLQTPPGHFTNAILSNTTPAHVVHISTPRYAPPTFGTPNRHNSTSQNHKSTQRVLLFGSSPNHQAVDNSAQQPTVPPQPNAATITLNVVVEQPQPNNDADDAPTDGFRFKTPLKPPEAASSSSSCIPTTTQPSSVDESDVEEIWQNVNDIVRTKPNITQQPQPNQPQTFKFSSTLNRRRKQSTGDNLERLKELEKSIEAPFKNKNNSTRRMLYSKSDSIYDHSQTAMKCPPLLLPSQPASTVHNNRSLKVLIAPLSKQQLANGNHGFRSICHDNDDDDDVRMTNSVSGRMSERSNIARSSKPVFPTSEKTVLQQSYCITEAESDDDSLASQNLVDDRCEKRQRRNATDEDDETLKPSSKRIRFKMDVEGIQPQAMPTKIQKQKLRTKTVGNDVDGGQIDRMSRAQPAKKSRGKNLKCIDVAKTKSSREPPPKHEKRQRKLERHHVDESESGSSSSCDSIATRTKIQKRKLQNQNDLYDVDGSIDRNDSELDTIDTTQKYRGSGDASNKTQLQYDSDVEDERTTIDSIRHNEDKLKPSSKRSQLKMYAVEKMQPLSTGKKIQKPKLRTKTVANEDVDQIDRMLRAKTAKKSRGENLNCIDVAKTKSVREPPQRREEFHRNLQRHHVDESDNRSVSELDTIDTTQKFRGTGDESNKTQLQYDSDVEDERTTIDSIRHNEEKLKPSSKRSQLKMDAVERMQPLATGTKIQKPKIQTKTVANDDVGQIDRMSRPRTANESRGENLNCIDVTKTISVRRPPQQREERQHVDESDIGSNSELNENETTANSTQYSLRVTDDTNQTHQPYDFDVEDERATPESILYDRSRTAETNTTQERSNAEDSCDDEQSLQWSLAVDNEADRYESSEAARTNDAKANDASGSGVEGFQSPQIDSNDDCTESHSKRSSTQPERNVPPSQSPYRSLSLSAENRTVSSEFNTADDDDERSSAQLSPVSRTRRSSVKQSPPVDVLAASSSAHMPMLAVTAKPITTKKRKYIKKKLIVMSDIYQPYTTRNSYADNNLVRRSARTPQMLVQFWKNGKNTQPHCNSDGVVSSTTGNRWLTLTPKAKRKRKQADDWFSFLTQNENQSSIESQTKVKGLVIYHSSALSHAEKDDIHYWHYTSQSVRSNGYIKMPPNAVKNQCKSSGDLMLTVLHGTLHITVDDLITVAGEGDQLCVENDTLYKLKNNGPKELVIFFSKLK